tara:strand:- start:3480 stop:3773 length:294 start_codon:yes stop_codon:yes gene_type:complete
MITIADAIKSLVPTAIFSIIGDDYKGIDWQCDDKKPTNAEVDAEIKKLQAEYDANEYQRSRASEYPSIPDQLDEIYHNGVDSWKAVIKKTKDKYPKG